MSGDINQPDTRKDLIKAVRTCSVYHIKNIKHLAVNHSVKCNILINYKTKLIPNLINTIVKIFTDAEIDFRIETILTDEVKESFFNDINYHTDNEVKEDYGKFIIHSDSLWIQPYQFFKQANSDLSFDYYIRTRLDCYILNYWAFIRVIDYFCYARKRYHDTEFTKGYCVASEILLNGLAFSVDIRDTLYAMDRSAVINCWNNISSWMKLKEYNKDIFYCEEILASIIVKNNIVTVACPDQLDLLIYRSQWYDNIPDNLLMDPNKFYKIQKLFDNK